MIKKVFITFVVSLLLLPLVGVINNGSIKINGDEYYPMACSIFEVSEAKDDGSLKKVSCHDSFSDAKKVMSQNENYVVRLSTSLSPMKIVAMNRGYAYTYPYRSGGTTMNIYYTSSWSTTDTTYIGIKGIEMTYLDTYSLNDALNGYGKIHVVVNGFKGYCDLEYTDLVPAKFVENGIACYLGGNDLTNRHEQPYKVICKQNYYLLKQNNNYLDMEFHYYYNYPTSGYDPYSVTSHFTSGEQYTGFMEVGRKYYSNDGINFYSDCRLTNYVGSTYAYYQFLPVRSRTNISASTFNNYVKEYSNSVMRNEGQTFIDSQDKYGVNALILFAMACHESSYGTSGYARDNYNLFGWNAIDSDPDQASSYPSVKDCVYQHAGYNLRKYLDRSQGLWYGSCIGTKGVGFNVNYASDPYWGYSISAIAYQIDKANNNYNGNLSDYGSVNVGVVTEYNCSLYSSDSTSSSKYYSMKYRENHFNDYTVAITGSSNGMYQTMSTNPITSSGKVIDLSIGTDEYKQVIKYDWDASRGYIKGSSIKIVDFNGGTPTPIDPVDPIDPEDYKLYTTVNEINFNSDELYIDGIGAIYGFNMTDLDKVKHVIDVVDMKDSNKSYRYIAESCDSDGYDLNDGFNYKYAGYKVYIPISELPYGCYLIKLTTTYEGTSLSSNVISSELDYRNLVSYDGEDIYRLTTSQTYRYRLELDIFKSEFDYTSINKPSKRDSLISYDNVYVDENEILHVQGIGYIFYTDFDIKDNIDFDICLVNNDRYYSLDTEVVKESGYAELLGIDYNLDYIGYDGSLDVSRIEGDYSIVLRIKNGSYIDICEISGNEGQTIFDKTINGTPYKIYASNIRGRLQFYVED